MKGKNLQPSILYPVRLFQILWRNQKLFRQAKVKRFQHHESSLTTNAKGTSLGRKQGKEKPSVQFSSLQSLSCVWLFVTLWIAAGQASLSISNFRSLLKLMSIESVMPSNHFILCYPLFLPPSIFLSIRVSSNKSALPIRWPKYWSFSFSISSSNEHSGLISLRIDWFDLFAVQGTIKSLLQHHS